PGGSFVPVSSLASQVAPFTYGDTYTSALLAQNASNAFYLSDFNSPNPAIITKTYNGASAAYGTNGANPGTALSIADVESPSGGNFSVITGIFSANGTSDLLPAGVNPGSGVLTSIRMDMGQSAAGADKLSPFPLFNIISAQVVLFQGATPVFSA